MLNMIILTMLIFLISSLMLFINLLISSKSFKTREKISPFECGFDPMNNNRMPFSIHFFLISLIFLIFDIEITLLIPLIFMFFWFNKIMIFSFFLFMLILILGLYIEYLDQSMDWKI